VEDNSDDELLVRMAFKKAGYESHLFTATDAEQAMNYLQGTGSYADRARYPLPQAILLDLKMPGMTGLELLAWLRQQPQWGHLPVIILSTSPYPQDIKEAYRLGANSYVVKPIDYHEFTGAIKKIGDFWLSQSQLPDPSFPPPNTQPGSPTGPGV